MLRYPFVFELDLYLNQPLGVNKEIIECCHSARGADCGAFFHHRISHRFVFLLSQSPRFSNNATEEPCEAASIVSAASHQEKVVNLQ